MFLRKGATLINLDNVLDIQECFDYVRIIFTNGTIYKLDTSKGKSAEECFKIIVNNCKCVQSQLIDLGE